MAAPPPVLIVGAGIAGLTAALALAARGREVVVLERAARLQEVGAGLQLSPNASRVLLDLGLGDALAAAAVEPERLSAINGTSGSVLSVLPLGRTIRSLHGAPYLVVHRGDLQAILAAAALSEPRITLRLGVSVEEVEVGADGVSVRSRAGETSFAVAGETLVGADGVASMVRTRVLGGPQALYGGRTAWRARVPAVSWHGDPEVLHRTSLYLGERAHLVVYPIRGGREINLVAIVEDAWTDERWDVPGDPSELAAAYARWCEEARALVALPQSWRRWALRAVPSGAPWARGPVALVGDAAHAMLPFAAQGGAMAIEDAAVLARVVADGSGPAADRLAAYVALRRPRVEAVVTTAARNGRLYHLSGLPAAARDAGLRLLGPRILTARMGWIWSWRDEG